MVGRTLYLSGAFKRISPGGLQAAGMIKGMMGAEDITVDFATGLALVSSDDRRSTLAGNPRKGAIYQLDLQAENPNPRDLTVNLAFDDFHPHGISLYSDPAGGAKWVLAINHRQDGHTVEVFRYTDSTLVHAETLSDPGFASPNDLVAVGPRSFYFTNDHDSHGGISRWKDFLVIGTGQLGYYDGKQTKVLDQGIRYANGIARSPDGKRLYVAACTDLSVLVYHIAPFSRVGRIPCGTGVDNLEWDEEGNLWVGAHAQMLAFLGHAGDPAKRSPSEVLQISFPVGKAPIVRQRYLSDGNPISGSSVAAPYRGKVYVGSVFEDGSLLLTL